MSKELKIAIDFDGTIANTNSLKQKWIYDNLGINIDSWLCDRTSCERIIDKYDYEKMSKIIYNEFSTALLIPNPGTIISIKELKKISSTLYVFSARTKDKLKFAIEWLKNIELFDSFDKVISVSNKEIIKTKMEMANELGCNVLIDDDERHLINAKENNVIGILLKIGAKRNSIKINNMEIIYSWEDAVSYIKNIRDAWKDIF